MTSTILLILLYVIRPTLEFESNSFLIYSEDHKKCLQVEDSLIKVADCMEDNDAQKFHWISQHQLINVAMPQCLGVSSKKEMSLVSLSPCDGENELQRWECKNDTLFGIQGEDLYLNNGNAKNRVVTLKASIDSSQWKIYGTPDDLCVKAYEEIYTLNGNGNGQPCVFPFKFESKWYADCTATGATHGDLWCATTANYDKDSLWGYCPIKTTREGWWTTDSITDSQYQINGNSALTWYQARKSCHQQGAELLSITELHEQTYISGLTSATKTSLWVGLSSLDLNAGWKWNDGSPFRYLNWLPGNPSAELGKNCVSVEPTNNAKWENKECSQKLGYICKKGNITSYISLSATEPINCPPIWISYAGFCYYMYKEAKNWQDAMLSCRKEEGDLASLHNVEEASFANSNFEFEDAEHVWLGLNDLKTQMFFEWSDGTPVTYTVWQRGEPSHINDGNEDCVALNTKVGHWSDQACEKKFPYMCKRKPMPTDYDEGLVVEAGCSTGWKRHGLYCYFVGEEISKFTEANSTCIAHAAFLMTVEDRFEQAYLTNLIGLREEKYFWIGLSDMEEKGTFKWTTKERVLYTHWDADMPGRKEGCVVMRTGNKGGLWDVINCDKKAKFVCKKLAQGVTPPPIPTTTAEPKCPTGWTTDHHISSCFKYYTRQRMELKTWFEAREFCQAIGGDLASINSKQDEDTLFTMLHQRSYIHVFWIGLENRDPDEGFQWSDGSPLVYQNWGYGEPYNHRGLENCVILRVRLSMSWNDVHCEHPQDWICELKKGAELKPEPTNPPYSEFNLTADGWLVRGDRQYYIAKDEEMAMDRARNFCREKSSDLVTINDDDERKFLWRYIIKARWNDAFYIGMQLSVDKQFKWMDGSPVDYVAWAANEPTFSNNDENCVVLELFSVHYPSPPSLQKAMALAIRIDSQLRERKMEPVAASSPVLPPANPYEEGRKASVNARKSIGTLLAKFLTGQQKNTRRDSAAKMTPVRDTDTEQKAAVRQMQGVMSAPSTNTEITQEQQAVNPSWETGGRNRLQGPEAMQEALDWDMGDHVELVSESVTQLQKDCPLLQRQGPDPRTPDTYQTRNFQACPHTVMPSRLQRQPMTLMNSVVPNGARHQIKEEILRRVWRKGPPEFDGTAIQILPDLCRQTLYRRHLLKPLLEKIKETDVTYRWGYPFSLMIRKQERTFVLHHRSQLSKCYKIFGRIEEEEDHLVEWHTGRSACQQLGGNLASIHDYLVQAFLTYNLKDLRHPVWIGLNDISENKKYRWTDQSGVYYINWAKGHPNQNLYNRDHAKIDCVAMKVGKVMDAGTWIEEDCELKRGYICQKSEDPALPFVTTVTPFSEQYKFGDASYKVQKTKMKWDDAREKCKQSDYELASIIEPYAASFLRVQLDKFKEPFWIGLYSDNKTYNQYKWSDGWKLNYNKWAPREPKEKNACVYFNMDGQWKTASCDEHYASICKQTSVRAPTEPPQKPGKCPESSSISWIPFRSHCYFLEAEMDYEWGEATIKCLQKGGNLVSIEDQHEADFLISYLVLLRNKASSFWIGAYRNVEGKWLWIDNTPMDYVNWDDGEPEERSYLEFPEPIANTTNPEKSEGEQKPMHGIAVGVSIFIIAVVATTAIAVYLVYLKKRNTAPPTESSINNTVYIKSSHDATIQETNILVNNMEQM
ncbi:macrophage mannose receptor 1-like [Mantella aurantiaca]